MTTPPDAYTAELESMIAFMSGDESAALVWISRTNPTTRHQWISQLRGLADLTEKKARVADALAGIYSADLADRLKEAAALGVIPSMTMCGQTVVPLDLAVQLLKGELT